MNPQTPLILCVDDEKANLKLLEDILVPRGYSVVTAASGEDALLKIKSQPVDLVLLDIMMPGMNGFEVCRQIKEDTKLRNIPVIMITALTAKQDRIRGIEAGAEEFLSKPFDQTEALARIKLLLQVKELSDQRQRAEEALQNSHDALDFLVQERTAELAQANAMLQAEITKLQQTDEALRLANSYNRNLIEVSLDPLVTIGEDGKITDVNAATEAVTGFARSSLIGSDFSSYFTEPEKAREGYQQVFRAGFVRDYPLEIEHRDGNITSVLYNAAVYKDDPGNVIGVFAAARDITERKKLEDQLRHAQKMEAVGTLAGGIAHDFNNILNVILGYGGMVYDDLETGSPAKAQMHEVLIAADRATNLTKRLLLFSRKQIAEVKPINLNEVALGLQKMLLRIISESIDFSLDLTASPLVVLADAGQLEQVLINLAVNAKDAMPDGGRLTITTSLKELDAEYVAAYGYGKPGRYALITVADTGQGMDAKTQEKVFEPFFTTKGVGEGTGLGLAISYGIINQHHGYIKVYSEPGRGAEFKIYLPLSEEAALPEQKSTLAVPIKGGHETILMAEDDAAVRNLAMVGLESYGYRVIAAENGEEATSKFIENRDQISLVVLDMIMPKKNGKEVAAAIRKVSPQVKVLFASGYTMDIIKSRELAEADFDFISKPFLPKELAMKVRMILDR